jgi:putative membrane protein
MSNTVFDIPMYRICATITGNLLGAGHPLAQPRQSEKSIVWM